MKVYPIATPLCTVGFLIRNYSASSGKLLEKERSSVKKTRNDCRKA